MDLSGFLESGEIGTGFEKKGEGVGVMRSGRGEHAVIEEKRRFGLVRGGESFDHKVPQESVWTV